MTKKMLDEVSESHYHESVNLETGMVYHEREMESARQRETEKKEEAEKKSLIKRQTQMDPLRFLDPDYVEEELSESSEVLETPISEQSKETFVWSGVRSVGKQQQEQSSQGRRMSPKVQEISEG